MRGKTEKNRTVFDYTGNASIHIFRGFNHGGQYPVLWVAAGCPAMAAVDGQYTCVGTFGRVCLSDKQGVCLSKQKFCREMCIRDSAHTDQPQGGAGDQAAGQHRRMRICL